jgi:tripartite-type tricarboxylate transporter receptor subunit TctC
VLASNASVRSPQAPDIPTVAETVPGFDFAVVIGVMAAEGTPQAAITRISQEIAEVVKHPEVIKNFQTAVIDPVGGNAQVYAQAIARENEAMARAAKAADLKAE